MIDAPARTKFSELIRGLVAGRLTNDEFEDAIPRSLDVAIHEVYFTGIWGLYSDLHEYRLTGKDAVPRQARPDIARCILFLKSGLPYEWPRLGRLSFLLLLVATLLTLGIANRIYLRWFSRQGDIHVWPFIRRSDYDSALTHPPYLHERASYEGS
ncbi:MAG: hypothetical protein ABSG80_05350 [Verrucomicrobiota bacterium]|jgi:hypothetical protein